MNLTTKDSETYILQFWLFNYQFIATHLMASIGFTPNIVSVFCRRYFLSDTCTCIFCKQIEEYYLCLKDLNNPCRAEFKNFKGLCKHFERVHKIYTPYNKHPQKARKKIKNYYCKVQKRTFQQ